MQTSRADDAGPIRRPLVCLVLALIPPRIRPLVLTGAAYALCVIIELAQLTGVPAVLTVLFPPVRLLLGTTFAPLDLAIGPSQPERTTICQTSSDGAPALDFGMWQTHSTMTRWSATSGT